MRRLLTARIRHGALAAVLLLGCYSGLLLAASGIGLPYTVVAAGADEDRQWGRSHSDAVVGQEQGYVVIVADPVVGPAHNVDIAAGPLLLLSPVEVAPDSFSAGYRSGIDVYRSIAEGGLDNEPMRVVYAQADPAMALPEVVVTPASIDQSYDHITAAQPLIDPVIRGEDRIYLTINTLPAEERSPLPLKPQQRRFFSQKQDPEIGF